MGCQVLQGSLSEAEMEKCDMLWFRYEQRIVVQGDTFENVKHSLNLIDDEHFLLRSKTRYNEFDKLATSRKLHLLLRSHSHFKRRTRGSFSAAGGTYVPTQGKKKKKNFNSTLDFLCNKYWLIRERQSIKSLLRQYVTCNHGGMAEKEIHLFFLSYISIYLN